VKRLLLIEDNKMFRDALAEELHEADFQVDEAEDGQEALQKLESQTYTATIIDLNLPGELNGIEILDVIRQNFPETVTLIITAFATVHTAVEAMKKGADDYLTKPFETEKLLLSLDRAIKLRTLESDNINLRRRLGVKYQFEKFIGISESILRIKETLRIIVSTDETILIEGETGTGKEVIANIIHENSGRRNGPFMIVSCAALSAQMLETELFGHEKGAFTGAYKQKIGQFELASGGTVFLDEVDDIPFALQVKLLRVLEMKELRRIGGTEMIKVNTRIIAATKQNLQILVDQKSFREDLYYRLNVVPVNIPPLRDRREDILPLVEHFLDTFCLNSEKIDIEPDAMQCLLEYSWPGNVRQLENTLKRIVILGQCRTICKDMIPPDICHNNAEEHVVNGDNLDFEQAMASLEHKLLTESLQRTKGNKLQAAKLLKMKPSTFRNRFSKYK